MPRASWLSGILSQFRALNVWARVGALGVLVLVVGVTGVALSSAWAGAEEPALVATPATATPTPSPTPSRTPSPTPTPTPEPLRPSPAEEIPLGESAGLANPSSVGFPLPPPSERVEPGNSAGIRRIVSPALGLDHYVEDLGIVDGRMQSPDEDGNHSVGWYASDETWKFGTPGVEGNAVFSAHETWNHLQGPFYLLHQARVGDEIFLDMADGERRRYQVARVTRYGVDEMPMREVLWPSDRPEFEDWITLYTCGGEIIYDATGYGDYLARDVLVAKWVGSTFPEGEPDSGTDGAADAPTEAGPAVGAADTP